MASLQKSYAANPDMGVHVERRDAAEVEAEVEVAVAAAAAAAAAAGVRVQDDVEIVPDFEFGGLLQSVVYSADGGAERSGDNVVFDSHLGLACQQLHGSATTHGNSRNSRKFNLTPGHMIYKIK